MPIYMTMAVFCKLPCRTKYSSVCCNKNTSPDNYWLKQQSIYGMLYSKVNGILLVFVR